MMKWVAASSICESLMLISSGNTRCSLVYSRKYVNQMIGTFGDAYCSYMTKYNENWQILEDIFKYNMSDFENLNFDSIFVPFLSLNARW